MDVTLHGFGKLLHQPPLTHWLVFHDSKSPWPAMKSVTGWGGVAGEAIDRLAKTGGLQPREIQPSRALLDARDAVSKLVMRWDDQLADKIAAENLFLDRSKDRRRNELVDLHAKVGTCAAPDRFDIVENALRGQWTMKCERGSVRVAITLAPTMPPTVQYMSVREAPGAPQRAGTCTSF
jgi:hypothetical protein